MIDLRHNYPVLADHCDRVRVAVSEAATTETSAYGFGPHEGRPDHRALAARFLERPGQTIDPEQVVLTSGGHQALSVIALGALPRGAVVASDAISYSNWSGLARLHGLDLVSVDGDGDGMTPEGLDARCRARHVDAVYLMPTLHNPLSTIMPLGRREALIEICRRHGLTIIEDEAYAFLVAAPPPTFAQLAPERTLAFTSLTKAIVPAIKVAFLVVPPPLVAAVRQAVLYTSHGASGLIAAAALALLETGELAQMAADKQAEARCRQAWAREVWNGPPYQTQPTSMHLWLPLPGVDTDALTAALVGRDILVSPGSAFAIDRGRAPAALRIALGAERDRDRMQAALRTIVSML